MATEREIELCQGILGLAITINAQRKLCVSVEFSGHVDWISIRIQPAPWSVAGKPIDGWTGYFDESSCVKLSTDYRPDVGEYLDTVIADTVAKLEMLKANLHEFIDIDADGVPV